uniref:Uncharacterized protein n=1 Tax=Glyptapanteles indiensis TaxID=92994 RepID=B7S8V1_GLYIN|nr:conserved hypothetical protein [Glyptapanteles indiensis]
MVYHSELHNWVKLNDPFFSMFSEKCRDRMIWLLRTLPTTTPTKEGTPFSVLEFFLSMEEATFWSVMDRCPDCTSYILFAAYNQRLQRKARQLANMANQENDAGIDLLFQLS